MRVAERVEPRVEPLDGSAHVIWRGAAVDGRILHRHDLEQRLRRRLVQRVALGRLEALVLLEVDDLIVSGEDKVVKPLKETMCSRFHFGKWKETEYD